MSWRATQTPAQTFEDLAHIRIDRRAVALGRMLRSHRRGAPGDRRQGAAALGQANHVQLQSVGRRR
jgi:hypothetical protein